MRRLRREERGTAVVEFAVVAVLFVGLIYGGITYGMIFWVKHTMTHAASEGARSALTVGPGPALESAAIATATTKAEGAVAASLDSRAAHATVNAAVADCAGSSQRCITVTVSYPYEAHPVVAPLFLPFVPAQLTSTAVVELNS